MQPFAVLERRRKKDLERRRRAVAGVLAVYCWTLLNDRPSRRVYRHYDRIKVYEDVRALDDDGFTCRYRITPARFDEIFDKLAWPWEMDAAYRLGPHPAVKILCALRQITDLD